MIIEHNPDFIAGYLPTSTAVRFFIPLTTLSDWTEMIIMGEFLLHANLPSSVRKSQYQPPVKL